MYGQFSLLLPRFNNVCMLCIGTFWYLFKPKWFIIVIILI